MKNFFSFIKQRYCSLYCDRVHDKVCELAGCRLYSFLEWLEMEDLKKLVKEHNMIEGFVKEASRPKKIKRKIKFNVLEGGMRELQS